MQGVWNCLSELSIIFNVVIIIVVVFIPCIFVAFIEIEVLSLFLFLVSLSCTAEIVTAILVLIFESS